MNCWCISDLSSYIRTIYCLAMRLAWMTHWPLTRNSTTFPLNFSSPTSITGASKTCLKIQKNSDPLSCRTVFAQISGASGAFSWRCSSRGLLFSTAMRSVKKLWSILRYSPPPRKTEFWLLSSSLPSIEFSPVSPILISSEKEGRTLLTKLEMPKKKMGIKLLLLLPQFQSGSHCADHR